MLLLQTVEKKLHHTNLAKQEAEATLQMLSARLAAPRVFLVNDIHAGKDLLAQVHTTVSCLLHFG